MVANNDACLDDPTGKKSQNTSEEGFLPLRMISPQQTSSSMASATIVSMPAHWFSQEHHPTMEISANLHQGVQHLVKDFPLHYLLCI